MSLIFGLLLFFGLGTLIAVLPGIFRFILIIILLIILL